MLVRENWDVLRGIVDADTLDSTDARALLGIVTRMHGETEGDLQVSTIRLDIEASYPIKVDLKAELLAALQSVEEASLEDAGALKRTVKRFISRDKSLKALAYVGAHVDDDNYDPSVPMAMLNEAVNASVIMDSEVLDFSQAGSPSEPTRTGVIGFGISEDMDLFLDGGGANGELAMYVAPAGVGKTSYLWASAAYAASKGRNVLGITLEINSRKCVQRVDQWLTRLDKYTLIANPVIALKKREEMSGKIWIKDWTAAAPTVDDIRALVLQMRQKGQAVDYLMIDYMELVRPDHFNINQVRHGYSQIAKSLRSLAKELDILVLTAWQTNRAGADKHVLSKTDVGEDWGVVKIADIALGLNQNAEELRDKIMRVNILKQRESTARNLVTLHCDLDSMVIQRIDASADKEPEEVGSDGTEPHVAGSRIVLGGGAANITWQQDSHT